MTRRGNRPCNIISTSFHTIIIIQRSENHTHRHFHDIKARVTLNMTATTTARRPPSTVAVGPRAIVLNESPSVTPSGSYSAANSNGVTVNIIGIGEFRFVLFLLSSVVVMVMMTGRRTDSNDLAPPLSYSPFVRYPYFDAGSPSRHTRPYSPPDHLSSTHIP